MRDNSIKVGVAFGGPSPEYEISLNSGQNVCKEIPGDKYAVYPVHITNEGFFQIADRPSSNSLAAFSQPEIPAHKACRYLKNFDVIFNTVHGPYGEDGNFQGFLEVLGIPCTGSNTAASALAIDKMRARMIMKEHGIPVPESVYLHSPFDKIPFMPAVIKPNAQGSSVGVTIAKSPVELSSAIELAFSYGNIVIAEEYLEGQEITCSVLQRKNSKAEALPVTLIVPKTSEFFDIKAKYEVGASDEITPAPIPENSFKLAQELAVRCHEALGCSGVTRTDIFLMTDGSMKVIEINTLPGMTNTSLVPQAAKHVGISFGQLLDIMIEGAL